MSNGCNAVIKIEVDGANLPRGGFGGMFLVGSAGSTIRGLAMNHAPAGSFYSAAVTIAGPGVTGLPGASNVVEGCFIGTDASGKVAKTNDHDGILIWAAGDNLIGGTTPAARNIISASPHFGIYVLNSLPNTIQGSYIGVDCTGTNALPNQVEGIVVNNSNGTIIGGESPGAGNVISGNTGTMGDPNTGNGLWIAANLCQILGNRIGTDPTGVLPVGNEKAGIFFTSAGNSNFVGNATAPNIIAFNGSNGVEYTTHCLGPIAINVNSIHSNGGLGIDAAGTIGVDPNDECDTDACGTEFFQNYPVLTAAASSDANSITITGFLDSTPDTTFRLEFFGNSACDPSGFGEGEFYLGFTNVTTGANCTNQFSVTLPVGLPCMRVVTATATDPRGETSEFSPCVTAELLDTDGDGQPDVCEPLAGTDPTDAGSVLAITSIAREGDNIRITWKTAGVRTNRLQSTTGAAGGSYSSNFTDLTGNIILPVPGDALTNFLHVGGVTNIPARYYRVRLAP